MENRVIKCSFCGQSAGQVYSIVVARKAAICNACVSLCVQQLLERQPLTGLTTLVAARFHVVNEPSEITAFIESRLKASHETPELVR